MALGAFKTLSLFLALIAIPQALAGPGCARRNYGKPDCVEKCRQGWGVAGHYMGNNKWGSVMNNTDSTDLDSIVAAACGLNQTATSDPGSIPTEKPSCISSSTPPPANGYEPTPSASNPGEPSSPPPSPPSSPSSSPPSSPPTSPPTNPDTSPTTPLSPPSSSPPPPPPSPSTPSSSSSQAPPPSPTSTPGDVASPVPSPSPSPVPSPNSSNSSSTPAISDTTSSFESDALAGHNNFRALHGASPLAWSDDLASAALTWVSGCVFQHSQGKVGPYGENLAAGTGGGYTITDAINDWTSEASSYDPNNPVYSHFTQVVWKSTTQVGCAVYTCPAGSIFDASWGTAQFIACEYNPPGNVEGEFPENVQV